MTTLREKYAEALSRWSEHLRRPSGQSGYERLMVAIYLTQLGDFAQAQAEYREALEEMLEHHLATRTSMIDMPVNTFVLAGGGVLADRVFQEVDAYRLDRRHDAAVAIYAYALVDLINGKSNEARAYTPRLLRVKRWRDMVALGRMIGAIADRDQAVFDSSLADLLKAHAGQAKFGQLRETPEGFLCLSAMALSRMAAERGLVVSSDSQYLSLGYLLYLMVK